MQKLIIKGKKQREINSKRRTKEGVESILLKNGKGRREQTVKKGGSEWAAADFIRLGNRFHALITTILIFPLDSFTILSYLNKIGFMVELVHYLFDLVLI